MIDHQEGYRRYRRYYRRLQGLYQKPPVRDFTFLVLSLLTVAFFGFFAIKPSLKTIGELVKEIGDKRMASEKLEQKINALSAAQQEYALVQPDLPLVLSVLPKDSDFSQLAKEIEYLASKNNLLLLSLRIQQASLFGGPEKKELISLDFDLNLSGDYLSLKNFLANLERLDRLVKIEALSFAKKEMLSLVITAKAYYLP